MCLKFAIIGCGRIAQRHAKHIQNCGKLVAVCDSIEDKAKAIAVQYDALSYTSAMEMLTIHPEIDVVAICSPNGLHAEHTIMALQAACHVVCEKPMALTVVDCEAMIEIANKMDKKLFVVKQNRFNPPVIAIKKALDEQRLGRLFTVQLNCFWNRTNAYYKDSWKGTKALDGGTLYTQFSHFIDLLYWMIGDVKEVDAFIDNYNHKGIIEFEDTGVAIFKFNNGAIGTLNYSVNSFEKNMEGSLTIIGEKGTIKIGGQYLNELEYQNIKDYSIEDLPLGNPANNYGTYLGSMSNHDKVYAHVVDVLNNGAIANTNSFDALKTVEIINKIYTSAAINNTINKHHA